MFEVIKRAFVGISMAGVITFAVLTVMKVNMVEATVSELWMHMFGSLIIGVYFGFASFLFDNDSWSPLKQTSVHFLLSICVFYPLALFVGWVPPEPLPVVLSFVVFCATYVLFWIGARFNLKKLEQSMNDSIRK
ncbi:DUF3021 domain-containing protein [Domibacillus epiphyticus]|uniref:DUF3021 domain-containing protein n=1 Tax=Domibacillus epiphyticus TaxID=1714355 RepID=A0A1V2AA63_9BACI|nr:DUF3021 domain-containing protein [Domibacillus epiphyticus]OMP67830.1 hypothetical protein BTO28_04915 [Domibacillus epiphyticus]